MFTYQQYRRHDDLARTTGFPHAAQEKRKTWQEAVALYRHAWIRCEVVARPSPGSRFWTEPVGVYGYNRQKAWAKTIHTDGELWRLYYASYEYADFCKSFDGMGMWYVYISMLYSVLLLYTQPDTPSTV